MTIPDSVANIPSRAFRSCSGLTRVFVGNSVTNIGYEAFYGIPSAKFYVSDIYAGPAIENKYIALMLSLPGERDLPEPKTVAAALTVPGSVLRYTTDGTIPTESSPVFETFRVTDSMTLTVGAFLDGERVLWTRGVYTKAWTWLEETVGGRSWAYRIVNGEATTVLRAYDSARGTYSPTVWPSSAGAVEIPSTLGGCPVTRIGEDSFRQYAGLTGVTIPTSVTVIASSAFRDCTGLTRVVIPDGVATLASGAFNGCTGMEAIFIGNGVTSIGTGALNNLGSAVRYISDIYAGPAISGSVVGLSLSPSGEQALDEPTTVTATCAVPGATMRYTTDGTAPTAASPVLAPFTVSASTTVTVGAFLDGQRVLTTRGVYTYMSGFVSIDGKGTIVVQDGGYFATANDGVTLVEGDFIFKLSSQAYTIDIAANGKTATVRLRNPEIGLRDGATGVTPDPDDPTGLLVIAPAAQMSAIPAAGSGQTVRALPVKAYPGFWYRASWGNALGGFTDGAKVQATGDVLYLGVIRQEGLRGFYRLTVSEE